jgi:2,4-dienoyl-CoA reductase-like NADH-dependent reductase (Old Yellow Enzyme family)
MAALTRSRNGPGLAPTDIMVEYYRQRAAGGVGLIISEGLLISRQG